MIRVLHLPDSIEKRNGRMSVIMSIYRKLDRSKVQFDFACIDYGFENFEDEIKELGGNVYKIPSTENSFKNIKSMVNELLKTGRYSFLHYHALSKWGCTLGIANKYHVKTIVHSHATELSDTLFKSIRNRIFSLNIFNYGDKLVAVSLEAGKKLFIFKKYTYIPNMINYKKYAFNKNNRLNIREKYGIEENDVLIGNVGRLSIQKNQEYAIKCLKHIKQSNFKLMFVGDVDNNQQIKKIKDLVLSLGLDSKVIFTGMVTDVERYYSAFDIFWLPSLYEGMPTVGIEAQANGLYVLVSEAVSKNLDITGNVRFLEIKEDNIENWANLTESLVTTVKSHDVSAITKIENSEFNSKKVIEQWKKLYEV